MSQQPHAIIACNFTKLGFTIHIYLTLADNYLFFLKTFKYDTDKYSVLLICVIRANCPIVLFWIPSVINSTVPEV